MHTMKIGKISIVNGILIAILIINYNYAQTTPPGFGIYHPCVNHSVIISNSNRTINYTLQNGEHDDCESSYITAGWYRYEMLQNIPTKPPLAGQCGSSSPIWLNGTYPVIPYENHSMLACKVGSSSNCEDSWNIIVQNCLTFNVIYLEPVSSCGRYCMEPEWTYPSWIYPCFFNNSLITGDYTRTIDNVLSEGTAEDCESSNLTAGWYRYDGYQNMLTTPPSPGQCGSSSPIWLNGTYPDMPGMMTPMIACTVSYSSTCQESWPVKVLNCYSYNVVYLQPNGNCSKYCMDSQPYQMPTGLENCYTATVIDDTDNRTVDYDLMMDEMEKCDNITEGWYRFQDLKNILNYPPSIGQCSSRAPIWLEGTYPSIYGETKTMKACMVSNNTNCENKGNVTVMNCYSFNVAYLTPFNGCGRICKEQQNSSGTTPPTMNHPCYSTSVIEGTYDRTFNYILQPGEVESCDNITEGWYTFASGQNVPTTSPVPGQCGSRSPIWFSGTYPTSFEETTTMKACMVSNFSNCEDSWNVTVMHCYGYNVAYMKEINDCGRVCIENNEAFNETINQQSATVHPSQSFIHNASVSQANLEASYTAPYSSFPPRATTVMSNTFSGEPIFTAPYSGYLPSETNYFYETASYEKTHSEHPSVDQLSSTESWNIQPTIVSDVTKSTSFPSTDSTIPFNMYAQTTPPGNGNYHPCFNHTLITSNFNRTINYTLQNGEHDDCESSYITAGWYRYEMLQNIPTKAPLPGQCGSSSPIWLNGTYSTNFDEYRSMSACQVGNSSICEKSWNVTVVSCMTFNVVYLEPVVSSCGRYCMESEWTYPSWYMPCFHDHTIITGDYTRTIDYVLSEGMSEDCESSNLTAGWYRYDGFQNIQNTPPNPGQCGSSSPIWLNGSSPSVPGESTTMTACAVSESSTCQESWPVTMLNCYTYNVAYLEPNGNCSRYCMDAQTTPPGNGYYHPCLNHTLITSNFNRTINYTLQNGEHDDCESSYITAGWYRYEMLQNIPTKAPLPGQCGSSSPIWLNGTYSTNFDEYRSMSACQVGNSSICEKSWNVTVLSCMTFNVVYLEPVGSSCGRYCMEPEWTYPSWYMPCFYDHTIITGDYTRTIDYVLSEGMSEDCESSNLTAGWYRYDGFQNIPNTPPRPGQCGSSSPIWLNGSSPSIPGESTTMTACAVSESSTCQESWPVTMLNCYNYNVAYLEPNGNCSRYCMVSNDSYSQSINQSSSTIHFSQSQSYEPTVSLENLNDSYTLPHSGFQPHVTSAMSDTWSKDTMNSAPSSGYQPHATPVMSDKWSQDTIYSAPSYVYQTHATRVMSDKWSQDTMFSAPNSGYPPHATPVMSYKWSQDTIYSEPSSGYQPHATPVMSDKWSQDTMFSAPNSGYPPHATPVMSDKWSQDTIYAASSSGYQPNPTPVMSDKWSQDTMNSAPSSGYQPHATPAMSDKWSQDTMNSAPSSGYQPHATPVMSDKWSQDTMNSASNSRYQPHATPVMSDKWSQDTMFSAPNSGYPPHTTPVMSDKWSQDTIYSAPNSGYQPHATPDMSDKWSQDTMHSAPNSGYQPHATPVMSDKWSQDTMFSAPSSGYPQSNTNYLYEPASSEETYSEHHSFYQLSSTESWNIKPTSVQEETMSTSYLSTDSTTPLEPNRLSSTDTLHQTASSERLYSEPESHYQSTTESLNIQPTSALNEMMSTTSLAVESTTQADEIVLSDFLSLSVDSSVPTFNPSSTDRQLMFKCKYYQNGSPILNDLLLDVKWEVNDVLFVEKYNLTLSQMQTEGRITKTDLTNAGISMGFNVKCGMRLSASSNSTYLESYPRYAGMEVWPKHMSLSSGESAKIYVWTTVPVACMYDSSSACDLTLEMNNFNEEFTSGAPMSCNQSITELTKPSVCGLVLDGWKTSSWQILDIKLPENTAQDQEYTAKLQLRVAFSIYDNFWVNYVLPEITISVINTNVTESYWNWYGFCFTGTDPWFFTTDWRWYDFHDEGEFSLFRHKTKPIEVNTIQRRFESHHSWTEHCAIAVRAASDVFIIYGCSRPTKWIVRRLGCQTGSEYLEVYHRWGTYEIVLPTGTRVYVWIAMNRRLNVFITFSRKDRYQTEGLCGTWNNNRDDDFTGRDGKVYDRAYPFARTWSVPASDSLFIAKTRTEKLSQSFMYCTCLGDNGGTLNGLSANVDCSWKESLPVCPPLNFGKQSCSIRSKRSTDEDDDDLTIDISPDILTKKEHTERTSEWINGWNESSADDACNSYFKDSVLFDACSSLSNVNVSSAITNCVLNIKVSGTDEYMADAFEMFKTECSNEVRTNNSLWTETNDDGNIVAQVVVGKLCPFDCKYKGIQLGDCVEGVCSCYPDLTGGDCRVNMSASPQILTNITDESFCDTSKRSCSHISVFGENFYESSNLGCLLQKAEIINNVLTANGTSSTTTGQMENIGEVKCPVSVNRRRKRSTTNETIQYYLVSVTNDGVTYSDSVPLILYDTSCYTCTTTDSNVNCQLRSDICVVDGICYSSSSSQCSSDESTESKLWIIGIVISVLLVVIIVILLVKWCKSPRRVFPLCGEDNADKPSSSELYEAVSRGNTPEPLTRVNL
ncbi:uncharacterized protein LOC143048184 isoform X4 [Mytilus galloprovincialis]|uniref:uncharacterized protein LOC143048184 isoform X4 n=1 Tax=Mytilus galloprovincialis TaxID=29158 RepID=UPI003F7BD3B8